MAWYVYLLRCGDGSLYTGCTNDLQRRLRAHQRGKGGRYTRSHLPVELVYSEAVADQSQALRRESWLSSGKGTDKANTQTAMKRSAKFVNLQFSADFSGGEFFLLIAAIGPADASI